MGPCWGRKAGFIASSTPFMASLGVGSVRKCAEMAGRILKTILRCLYANYWRNLVQLAVVVSQTFVCGLIWFPSPAILWACRQPTKTTSSYGPWPLTRRTHPSTQPRTSRRLATRHPRYQQRPRHQQTLLSGIHPPTLRTRPLDLGRLLS